MITVTLSQFEELKALANEAKNHKSKDLSYQRGVNKLGEYLLKKLNHIHKPKTVCKLCKKEDNATSK